ncbi:O-antigen ligase family protein [Cysteiniphilum sp. 6C5]|uniref:O-antigen ligase family protein n=1 Tax=unclassified Cysteiniphilum TaxID=2610889 RepID=UPI003F847244
MYRVRDSGMAKIAIFVVFTLLLLFMMTLPLSINQQINCYDQRRLIELALLGGALLPLVDWQFLLWCQQRLRLHARLFSLIFICILCGGFSVYFSVIPSLSYIVYSMWLLLGLWTLFLIYFFECYPQLVRFFCVLIVAFLIYEVILMFYGHVLYIYHPDAKRFHLYGVSSVVNYPHFVNPRFLDQVVSFLLPLSGWYCLAYYRKNYPSIRRRVSMCFGLLAASCGMYIVIISQSRVFIVEWIVVSIVGFLLWRQFLWRYLLWMLLAFILALLAYVMLSYLQLEVGGSLISRSGDIMYYADRLALIKLGLSLSANHAYVVGVGPGMYPFYAYSDLTVNAAHPHNIVILIAAEWGVLTAIIVFGLMVYLLVKLLCYLSHKQKRQDTVTQSCYVNNQAFGMVVLFAFIAGGIDAMFSGVGIMPLSQVIFICMLAINISLLRGSSKQSTKMSLCLSLHKVIQRGLLTVVLIVCAVSAVLCIGYSMKMYHKAYQNTYNYYLACRLKQKNQHISFAPNLWLNGWLNTYDKTPRQLLNEQKLRC